MPPGAIRHITLSTIAASNDNFARSALTAFNLAAAGFSAATDVLEAKAGFFAAYGVAESSADIAVKGLGKPFIINDPGLALKKFPCCFASRTT